MLLRKCRAGFLGRYGSARRWQPVSTISVRFFAGVRECLGKEQELIDARGIECAADVWRRVSGTAPATQVLVAVNQEYAPMDHPVHPGDEVAFFPPVTGG